MGKLKGKKIGKVEYLWDVKKRNVYRPSKEGLELFLKEVGGKSPFYYKNTNNIYEHRSKMSNGYLWTMWREVMGLDYRTGGKDMKKNLRTIEPFYWFVELEHLITNDEMFWCLITDVWCNKSEVFTDNPAILYRYGRDKVSLQKKMECADHLKTPAGQKEDGKHYTSIKIMMGMLEGSQHSIDKNIPDKDEVILYRSFKVEKGKSVRKGVKKINNPDYDIQEEGRGWCYSINKTNSIFLNSLLGTFYYKKYLNMNDDDARKHLQKKWDLSLHKMNDITLNCNFYNCIGTYKVNRKDIMFMTDDWGEMEVVVNPKDSKLIDYSFLNIFDGMTETFLRGLLFSLKKDDELEIGRSAIMNIDNFYSYCRRIGRKIIIEEPKFIIEHLKQKGGISDFGTKLLEQLNKGKNQLGFLVYADEDDRDVKKYVLSMFDEDGNFLDYKFA
jgi:uncharacterized protein YutE (UPF0331/DUF86 family)